MSRKIERFEGDPKRRWVYTPGGWPLMSGAITVRLQRKGPLWWRTIGYNYAASPGQIEWIKQVILDTPRFRLERKAREDEDRDAAARFLRDP